MSVASSSTAAPSSVQIILVDDDVSFRAGLRLWLSRFTDLQVVAEYGDGRAALHQYETELAEEGDRPLPIRPLLLINLQLGQSQPEALQGLDLCQQIRQQHPTVPILLLGARYEPVILAAAQQAGATGYCPRDSSVQHLEAVIRQVATGQPYWSAPRSTPSAPAIGPAVSPVSPVAATSRGWAIARRQLHQSGLEQIDHALEQVKTQLRHRGLSALDRSVLAGRQRELLAARWLVNRLLATPPLPDSGPILTTPSSEPRLVTAEAAIAPSPAIQSLALPTVSTVVNARQVQSLLFDGVLSKLQSGLQNLTDQPLEIDILRDDKRRELLYLTLRQLEVVLSDVRFSQLEPEQLGEKRSLILLDLWQTVLSEFLGKYYTLEIDGQTIEVVKVLLSDRESVQRQMLDRIPYVGELLAHLLFQTPLVIDGQPYAPGNPEALLRAELLLDHLLIQIANAVMSPILNRFADMETIKQTFYDRLLMSSREIERFRNNLAWKYRMERYVGEPTAIFESQYRLLTLQGRGIKTTSIYAPRRHELNKLSGLQFAVTLALETRDAIAPRLRAALSVVGSSLIYVLTDVVGRGIGLVGRGILKGIGSTWNDLNQRNRQSD